MRKAVIVVGAGPVGLMLATELRLGGIDVTVYERSATPRRESRGLGFNKRTLEVLQQRGLLSRLGEFRRGKHIQFCGMRIDPGLLDGDYFGVLGLPQFRTEAMLESRLTELGGSLRRGCDVTGFRETPDGVEIEFDGPDGRGTDSAMYLVGCDGAQSVVRTLAGIDFSGSPATRGMYMADIADVSPRQRPIGEFPPGGGMALAINLGDGTERIVIHEPGLPPRQDDGSLTFAEVGDSWQRMTGESVHHARPVWIGSFTNATGLAAEYRRGRVFLAGDAAHTHAPFAALGVSAGMQDAVNLGWKLAAAVNGWAPDGLLDTYHSERHPVARRLLDHILGQSLVALAGPDMNPLREILSDLLRYPAAARYAAGMVSGLDIRYDMGVAGHPVGLRMDPDREVKLADGGSRRVADLLLPCHGVLIATSPSVEKAAAGWSDRVDVVAGTWLPAEPDDLGSVLVRPDGYVAWAEPAADDVSGALCRWFGPAR